MKNHKIKCLLNYFADAVGGLKTFTIRYNDRDYKPGDLLTASEWDGKAYTGKKASFLITYKLTANDFPNGIKQGYCVLGIMPCSLIKHFKEKEYGNIR